MCTICKIVKYLVAILLTLATVAAFMGAWNTHMVGGVLQFGAGDASLALLTFVISITLWLKLVKKLCPCNKGGCGCGSGCGCGGGCNCGSKDCPECNGAKH